VDGQEPVGGGSARSLVSWTYAASDFVCRPSTAGAKKKARESPWPNRLRKEEGSE
jgi:hypothetical protein